MPSLTALAKRYDCELELYTLNTTSLNYAAPPAAAAQARSTGYALRVIKGRRLGFAAFENPRHIERALRRALKLAALGEAGDYCFATARGRDASYWHPVSEEVLRESFEALAPKRARLLERQLSAARAVERITTSQGARVEQRVTHYAASIQVASNGYEVTLEEASAALDWNAAALAARAEELALLARRTARPPRGRIEAVLDVRALGELLGRFVEHNWSGESLHRGRTRLRPGLRIAHSGVSIYDNPRLARGVASACWDGEGFATRRKALLERGVVKEFLWDMASAAKARVAERGNAARAGYQAPPSAALSNLEIAPGEAVDLVAECQRGIYVVAFLGAHAVNEVTGDWSLPIGVGYLVRHGELAAALKGATLVGNFFEVLKGIEFERARRKHGALLAPRACITARLVA